MTCRGEDVREIEVGHIKRNDPCPCGSGRKYKKCCKLLEEETPREEYGFQPNKSHIVAYGRRLVVDDATLADL
jgi:hypothetical protein